MMACYAIVIRVAHYKNNDNEIAVHFYKMDRIQRINLVQGLAQKIDLRTTQNKQNREDNNRATNIKNRTQDHGLYMFLMMASIVAWLTLIALYWK